MNETQKLKGRKILIVDDEPDILETLEELLDMCVIDTAADFEGGKRFLERETYDAAILDIMGVRGYDLLRIAAEKGIPALMLTAHALSPDNLVRSIASGAYAYVPKNQLVDIASFVVDIIEAKAAGRKESHRWFARLKPFFDRKFKPGWRKKDEAFWREFDRRNVVSKDDVDKII
ncbi:response regulator [Desulfococcus sp.]|uniref:response regulator n=1 Tax=Desulfococcus sp. TaxID=2025834 RepID=UPI003593BD2C